MQEVDLASGIIVTATIIVQPELLPVGLVALGYISVTSTGLWVAHGYVSKDNYEIGSTIITGWLSFAVWKVYQESEGIIYSTGADRYMWYYFENKYGFISQVAWEKFELGKELLKSWTEQILQFISDKIRSF